MKDDIPQNQVTPYGNTGLGKTAEVARMFDQIAGRYDLLNHLLSFGIDRGWRRKAVKLFADTPLNHLLDVATGTGDLAVTAQVLNPAKITGIDISEGMLEIGRKKIASLGLESKIELRKADSQALPFGDGTFDGAMVAFGVRNFEHFDKGLREIARVLKSGARIVVLEFSKPETFPVKQLYYGYFRYVLPLIGRLISKDKSAYSYLPESVAAFPSGHQFLQHLQAAGFGSTRQKPLTFGVASLYTGIKI